MSCKLCSMLVNIVLLVRSVKFAIIYAGPEGATMGRAQLCSVSYEHITSITHVRRLFQYAAQVNFDGSLDRTSAFI